MLRFFLFFCLLACESQGCCDCNSLLYEGYRRDSWWDKNVDHINFCYDSFVKDISKNEISQYLSKIINSNEKKPIRIKSEREALDQQTFPGINTQEPSGFFLSIDKIPCVSVSEQPKGDCGGQKKGLFIYFHNAGGSIFDFLAEFWSEKRWIWELILEYYDILIPELPGYNVNKQGDFSENTRNKQIDEIYKWCQENYANNFVVMGHSLGCHFAILLAAKAKNHCKHLFLANPFLTDKTAAKWIVGRWISKPLANIFVSPIYGQKLDNGEAIKEVTCNIDIYYSRDDELVDPDDAKELYKIAKAENNNREVVLLPNYYTTEDSYLLYRLRHAKFLPREDLEQFKELGVCFDVGHLGLNQGWYSLCYRLMDINDLRN